MNSTFRNDIQGLRAVAVILVVLYHVFPMFVSGGYIGVDIFFVLSGYLITGILIAGFDRSGGRFIAQFFLKRAARLLPLSASVVLAVLLLGMIFLPTAFLGQLFNEALASNFYVQNIYLSFESVDYLGSENLPTPLQHFWSLSIEEQFYVVLPFLIFFIYRYAPFNFRKKLLFALIFLFSSVSLIYSVVVSKEYTSAQYFSSYTRMWALGFGAFLAIIPVCKINSVLSTVVSLLLICTLLCLGLIYDSSLAYPGYYAVLPVFVTMLLVYLGGKDGLVDRVLSWKPLVYIGGLSYSIYLIHWPVLIFYKAAYDDGIGYFDGVLIILSTLILSIFTKKYIEDKFRYSKIRVLNIQVGVFAGFLLSFLGTVVAALLLYGNRMEAYGTNEILNERYPGPKVLLLTEPYENSELGNFLPDILNIKKDLPRGYTEKCHLGIESYSLKPCTTTGKGLRDVFVIGDSHAAQWTPAIDALAELYGWDVEVHTKSGCPVLVEAVRLRGRLYDSCLTWGKNVLAHINNAKPDLIIVSQSAGARLMDAKNSMDSVVGDTISRLASSSTYVIVIADTPKHTFDPTGCLDFPAQCFSIYSDIIRRDPLNAISLEENVKLVDMNKWLCPDNRCPAVVGNQIVWRDSHHLSATYSRSLAPFLYDEIENVEGAWW